MGKLKRKNGITLISLVVTIVVLLILAGISISMLTGQNGILNRATEAKEIREIANEKECLKLAMTNMSFEKDANLISRKEIFQNCLDSFSGNKETNIYIRGEGYTVHFL